MRVLAVALLVALPSAVRADDPDSAAPAKTAPRTQTNLSAIAEALRQGDAQSAIDLASIALDTADLPIMERADILMDRGLAREQLGDHGSANADFTAAIALTVLRPDELARALFDRGVTFDELGKTKEAIKNYSAALGVDPKFAPALNNRANAYRRSHRLLEARKDYQQALVIGDSQPEYPLYGLGKIAEVQGDTVRAREYYQKALAANALYVPASQRLAALENDVKRVDFMTPQPEVAMNNPPPPANRELASAQAALPLRASIIGSDPPEPRHREVHRTRMASVTQPPVPTTLPDAASPTTDAAPSNPPPNGGGAVQLGAWREQADAAMSWSRFMDRAGGLLDGIMPHIVSADVPGKGHYYRLRTDPVPDPAGFCEQLKAKGLACIVARG
jgi:tetratricopeptide (TPR) repeat protein